MTLSANAPYNIMGGLYSNYPVKASTTIYEGAWVGEDGSGYARGLTAGDRFLGLANAYVTNGTTAGANTVNVFTGRVRTEVTLTGTIKDVGRPVYASADDTITFVATSNSYVGVVTRYVDATHMEIELRPGEVDEFGPNKCRETKSANYTVDAQDSGKIIYVDTDAKTITLPATDAGLTLTLVNAGADGAVALTISPNSSDKIMGFDITAADDKDLVNTKATARRGDFVTLVGDGADGWFILGMRGTWARES
jgi:hypothetical protein